MAKKKSLVPTRKLGNPDIRADLADKVFDLLEDPARPGRVKYGSMRKYLERLVAEDLVRREAVAKGVLDEILEEEI